AGADLGRDRIGQTLVHPGHLQPGADRKAERRDDRTGRQPAARRRGRDHVAVAINDVDVAGVADKYLAFGPFLYRRQGDEGGFANAESRVSLAEGALGDREVGQARVEAQRAARAELARRRVAHQLPAVTQVLVGKQRHLRLAVGVRGVAIPGEAVSHGQFGGFGDAVYEAGRVRVVILEPGVTQHAQLLEKYGALAPEAALGHGVTAEVEGERIFNTRLPVFHVFVAQQAAVEFARAVAGFLVAVVGVDLARHKALVPAAQRGVDHFGAGAALGFGRAQHLLIGVGQFGQAEQCTGLRYLATWQPHFGRAVPVAAEEVLDRVDGLHRTGDEREAVAGVLDGGRQYVGQRP